MKNGKLTKSEAGRLGWEKSKEHLEESRRWRRQEYESNPVRCLTCSAVLPYEKRKLKFCSHSCSAKKNNLGVRRRGKAPGSCLNCGKTLDKSEKKFCNNKCQGEHQYREFVGEWISGNEDGLANHGLVVSKHVRRWLQDKFGNRCQVCFGKEWMGKPMPLTVDHIDGNYKHNRPENLRLVCGNCGMQLPTFTGKNRGHGRLARKQWTDKMARVMLNAP